ncbi:MAG: nucleotide exchange factor GrpE [Alphaproteobacteria bacterium]|nr:nucleotide exchange factor GrpE [Alphaproteobacteria bacterium]
MSDSDFDGNGEPAGEVEADISSLDATAQAAIVALQDEIEKLNDRLLRTAAELENTRRRAEREKSEASAYAIAGFARDLLSIADNFERALATAPEDPADMSAEGFNGLMTGVRMTEKELLKVLDRHGVKRIDPTGDKFDPNRHQAVAQAPAAGVPAGHVSQTAQVGFVLGDRVLRAAMVIVSTGAPEAEPEAKIANDAAASPAADEPADSDGSGSKIDTRV